MSSGRLGNVKSLIKHRALRSHEAPVMRKVMGFGCAEHAAYALPAECLCVCVCVCASVGVWEEEKGSQCVYLSLPVSEKERGIRVSERVCVCVRGPQRRRGEECVCA